MKKIKFQAAILAALAFAALPAAALEVISASPAKTEKGKKADFVFSGSIAVRNISFERGAVVMPMTAYKDRTYTDIKLLSRSFYGKLEMCFSKNNCAGAGKALTPKLSVLEVKQLKSKTRVANVTLDFDGDLSVTFGVIKKFSGESFAAYPDNFEVSDEVLKSLIEKKVNEAFEGAAAADKKAAAVKK
jgi:hypothetical protein